MSVQLAPSLYEREAEAWLAREAEHKREIAKLQMQLIRYRRVLVEAGIAPPDLGGADLLELWESCKRVVAAASELVATLGTSNELLGERWRP